MNWKKNLHFIIIVVMMLFGVSGYAGEYFFHIHDHLGNTRVVVDVDKNVVERYDYYPFGMVSRSSVSSDIETIQKFTGKELDDEHGVELYYFGARYHDPVTGRFVSVDPLAGKYPGLSPYVYCANNPLIFIDPDGRIILGKAGQTSDETKSGLNKATAYINKHYPDNPIAKAAKSTEKYYIVDTKYEAEYDPSTNTIEWNPNLGLETSDGKVLSPAIVLVHEFDHAVENTEHPKEFESNTVPDNASPYGNNEEKRVITGSETKAARATGEIGPNEVTRTNHDGKGVTTTGPTSNTVVKDPIKD